MKIVPVHCQVMSMAASVGMLLAATTARAQDAQGRANDASSPWAKKDHVILGIAGAAVPAYQGSNDTRILPLPAIDIQWGPMFANLRNGVGVNVIDNDFLTVGGSVTPMQGYRGRDVPDGIGRLRTGAGARGFVTLRVRGFVATVGATKGMTGGQRGVIADATLAYPIRLSSRLTLIPTVGTTWTDGKYNNRYFGIDSEQSAASGLAQFRPGRGFKDVSGLLAINYRLTRHINLTASGGFAKLVGDVRNSPIVKRETSPSAFLSMSYSF